MGKLAFIFPGQGSQFVGMGKESHNRFEIARRIYDQANDLLGINIKKLSFGGPEEELRQTRYTQPAVFVNSIAVSKLLHNKGIEPAVVAGHSLGEYSALVQAGILEFCDGLRIVKLRGELMQGVEEEKPGRMAAIIGLPSDEIIRICTDASSEGIAVPANFNSPEQVVISGSIPAIKKAVELAERAGAKRVVELQVSGASHSPLMEGITGKMEQALSEIPMKEAKIPVISNVTADLVTKPDEVRKLLVRQLVSPVKWVHSMERMVDLDVTEMIEAGPGNVLKGLMRRINRTVKVTSADDIIMADN